MRVFKHAIYLSRLVREKFGRQETITGAEIGVQRGFTAYHMLFTNPQLFYFMVDRWDPMPFKEARNSFSAMSRFQDDQLTFEKWEKETRRNVSSFGDRSVIIKADFRDGSREIDRPLDFCFLDAAHSYIDTIDQISWYEPLVRPGGIVAGHDYGIPLPGYEVVAEAVDEAVKKRGVELNVCPSSYVWWWQRPLDS